jgi:hypothetical protein
MTETTLAYVFSCLLGTRVGDKKPRERTIRYELGDPADEIADECPRPEQRAGSSGDELTEERTETAGPPPTEVPAVRRTAADATAEQRLGQHSQLPPAAEGTTSPAEGTRPGQVPAVQADPPADATAEQRLGQHLQLPSR